MTLKNCEKLLAHYEAKGMKKEASDIRQAIARKEVKPEPSPKPEPSFKKKVK